VKDGKGEFGSVVFDLGLVKFSESASWTCVIIILQLELLLGSIAGRLELGLLANEELALVCIHVELLIVVASIR
jgi:hypothetical protein